MKEDFFINNNADRARAAAIISCMNVVKPLIVTVQNISRTVSQNAQQWPILTAFSKQIMWPVNGEMQLITAEDWKDVLTCAYRNESPRVAAGLDGGSVLLGQRTSKFEEQEWSNWMSFLNWAAADKGVRVPVSKSWEKQHANY